MFYTIHKSGKTALIYHWFEAEFFADVLNTTLHPISQTPSDKQNKTLETQKKIHFTIHQKDAH